MSVVLRILRLTLLLGQVNNLQAVKPLSGRFLGRIQPNAASVAFEQLAAKLPPGVTKDLFQSFSQCGQCNTWKRLGEAHDGGYLSCMDSLQPSALQAAYSLGVEAHDQWSLDAFKTFNVPVFQYDCTVSGPPQLCDQCQFFQACVAGKNMDPFPGKTTWTLEEALQQSQMANAPKRSLLMKMDIEGSEWQILAGSDLSTLKKFRQLIIEFHHLSDEDKHSLYLKAMQKLKKAGFKVIHVHGNNAGGLYVKDGMQIPKLVEVTLDARVSPLPRCQDPVHEELDAKNIRGRPELEATHTQPSS